MSNELTNLIFNEDYRLTMLNLGRPDCIITSPPFHPEDLGLSDEAAYMNWYVNLITSLVEATNDYVIVFNSPTRRKSIYRQTDPLDEVVWIRAPMNYKYKTQPIFIYQAKTPSFNWRKAMWTDMLLLPSENSQTNIEGKKVSYIETIRGYMVEPVLNSQHPYEDPIDIYKYLLRMQLLGNPNTNFVYDPFSGFGTSSVAAKQLGLTSYGSEINPDWTKIANERLTRTLTEDNHNTEAWS